MVVSEMLWVSCFQTAPRLLPTDIHPLHILLSPSNHYLIQIILSKNADVLEPAHFLSSSRKQSGKGHVEQQCDFWSYHCFYFTTLSQETTSPKYNQSVSGSLFVPKPGAVGHLLSPEGAALRSASPLPTVPSHCFWEEVMPACFCCSTWSNLPGTKGYLSDLSVGDVTTCWRKSVRLNSSRVPYN